MGVAAKPSAPAAEDAPKQPEAVAAPGPGLGQVATYPAPDGSPASDVRFVVHVRGRDGEWLRAPVFDFFDQFTYNHVTTSEPHLAVFESAGKVSVRVTVKEDVRDFAVRPLSRAIPARREGSEILLSMNDAVRNVVLEINRDVQKPLLLFSNPPDEDPPERGPGKRALPNGGVYYGPGHYLDEKIEVIGQGGWPVVYIAPGAVVDAHVLMRQCTNLRITGGGIVYCRKGEPNAVPLCLDQCSGGEISNIVVASREENWTVWIHGSDHITFNNARIIGEIRDGIDPINSQYVTVVNSYIQSHDDATSVKGLQYAGGEPIEHILFENCIMNNQGGGWGLSRCLMEQKAPRCTDIRYKNCDVVHNLAVRTEPDFGHWSEGIFQIKPVEGDTSAISNIVLDDIRIEDCQDREYIVELNTTLHSGEVRDVTIRDVRVVDGPMRTSLVRGSDSNPISGVNVAGLFHGERRIAGPGADFRVGAGTEGVTFVPDEKMVETFEDWSKVHERSPGWRKEPKRLGLDDSHVCRKARTRESIVYRYDGLTDFFVRVDYHLSGKPDLRFSSSRDGVTYDEIAAIRSSPWSLGGGWSGCFFWAEKHRLADANYLRIEILEGSGVEWGVQLSEVELFRPARQSEHAGRGIGPPRAPEGTGPA